MNTGGREIQRFNVTEGCDRHCENCERYFDCDAQAKETFKKRGILALAKENLKSVKHTVAILGGKGGVGKSMLTVNLAAALVKRGRTVCILDQVYDCPAIPLMLGIDQNARLMIGENGLVPADSPSGVKVVSTGLILDPDEVIIWFHDMKRNATEELLCAVEYGNIDYLLIDVPAGTSSETVNAMKYIPDMDGAIVITVASEVSQNVARRCIYMLKKAKIPVLGVVENMSDSVCPSCGEHAAILQSGAGVRMAEREGVPFLAKLMISDKISTALDDGEPVVSRYPDSEESQLLMGICDSVMAAVERRSTAAVRG